MGALRDPSEYYNSSPPIIIGVDFGKQVDSTAIVVTEAIKVDRPGLRPEYRFEARHLERLPLGTGYLDVGKRVAAVVLGIQARPVPNFTWPPRITVVVDATGVGVSAADIVRDALHGTRARLVTATFTHGESFNRKNSREWTVGKGYLVKRLQALFQTQRIKLPADHPEAQAMTRELVDYEVKVDPDGDAKFGAFKVGAHDDLASALGLAVLMDPQGASLWAT